MVRTTQSYCGPYVPMNAPAKLPSLEGILRQIHSTPTPASQYSPDSRRAHAGYGRQMSPLGKQSVAIPSLRSIIHPSVPQEGCVAHASFECSPPNMQPTLFQYQPSAAAAAPCVSSPSSPIIRKRPAEAIETQGFAPLKRHTSSSSTRSRASKYCKIEGCERVSQRNNLCHSHGGKRLCKEPGCSSKDRGNGYCIKHGGGKICSVSGCEKKARRKGLCTQHFRSSDESVPSPPPFAGPGAMLL